jgi:hypothetical protein
VSAEYDAIQPRARLHLHFASCSRDDESIVLARRVDDNLGLSIKVETQAIATRLTESRRARPIAALAASDSRKSINTSIQRKIDAVGSTLVLDVKEQTHVVLVRVVVGGEVAALCNVDALVVGAETLQSVAGEGDLDGCRSVATDYACAVHAGAEPARVWADWTGAWDHRLVGFSC